MKLGFNLHTETSCQLLLVLWKTLLACCGGIRELARAKKLSRELAGLPIIGDEGTSNCHFMTLTLGLNSDTQPLLSNHLPLILKYFVKKPPSNTPRLRLHRNQPFRAHKSRLQNSLRRFHRYLCDTITITMKQTRRHLMEPTSIHFIPTNNKTCLSGPVVLSRQPRRLRRPHHLSQRNNSIRPIKTGHSCSPSQEVVLEGMPGLFRSLLMKLTSFTISTCMSAYPYGKCGVRERSA